MKTQIFLTVLIICIWQISISKQKNLKDEQNFEVKGELVNRF